MNNGFKVIIYDCDGVMFDSREASFAFHMKIINEFGKVPPDKNDIETMRVLNTYSNRDVIEYLFPGDDRREEVERFASNIDYREFVPFMRMEEGLVETLEVLKHRFGLAICTNRAISMNAVLNAFGLTNFFGCVMTSNKVEKPKPHPESLLKVIEHYQIQSKEALFVGDSDVDYKAAAAAKVPFVAYKADLPGIASIDRHTDILKYLG